MMILAYATESAAMRFWMWALSNTWSMIVYIIIPTLIFLSASAIGPITCLTEGSHMTVPITPDTPEAPGPAA